MKTLFFKDDRPMAPGQFYMVWCPGWEEIPLSASTVVPGDRRSITVAAVGDTTRALNSLSPGDSFSIRGPFGNGFELGDDWLWVAGGLGAAPITALLGALLEKRIRGTIVFGSVSASDLVLRTCVRGLLEEGGAQELSERGGRPDEADQGDASGLEPPGQDGLDTVFDGRGSLHICTDDGSLGFQGLASHLAHNLIMERKEGGLGGFGGLGACGPEPMLVTLLELAGLHDLPCQFSMERYMKCGVGICDSCTVDGLQVCRDGPVFPGEVLKELREFGRFVRGPSGQKLYVHEVGRRRRAGTSDDDADITDGDEVDGME